MAQHFDVSQVQQQLQDAGLDGWLLTDFRGNNPPACRVLGVRGGYRRWWYWIPSHGNPVKLQPKVDTGVQAALPGQVHPIVSREDTEAALRQVLAGVRRIAMEYSPGGANPYVATVDAGTIEFVRSLGPEVVSSQDLLQYFEARWTPEQFKSHLDASRALLRAFASAVETIRQHLSAGRNVTEYQVSEAAMDSLRQDGCIDFEIPDTAVTRHTMLPHYCPTAEFSSPIQAGDLVLMDYVARMNHPDAVYADYTRVFYVGDEPPERYQRAFHAIVTAREAALEAVQDAFARKTPIRGCDVDALARKILEDAGYGPYLQHRLGHNLGISVHGNGAHLDSVEMPDDRRLLPETAFTIEPGAYLEDFGVRTEINVYIDADGTVHVTGERPTEIECIHL